MFFFRAHARQLEVALALVARHVVVARELEARGHHARHLLEHVHGSALGEHVTRAQRRDRLEREAQRGAPARDLQEGLGDPLAVPTWGEDALAQAFGQSTLEDRARHALTQGRKARSKDRGEIGGRHGIRVLFIQPDE